MEPGGERKEGRSSRREEGYGMRKEGYIRREGSRCMWGVMMAEVPPPPPLPSTASSPYTPSPLLPPQPLPLALICFMLSARLQ